MSRPSPDRTARRAALSARVARKRAALAEQLARRRGPGSSPARRRWRLGGLLVLLLLLLWAGVPQCRCVGVPLEPAGPAAPPTVRPSAPPASDGQPALPGGAVPRQDRPELPVPVAGPLPWIDALELQVSARSPRLAACFEGASRPGALRWTAAIEPVHGTVSDVDLAPVLQSDPLTAAQRACVVEVLTTPPYRLDPEVAPAAPARIGLVIEF